MGSFLQNLGHFNKMSYQSCYSYIFIRELPLILHFYHNVITKMIIQTCYNKSFIMYQHLFCNKRIKRDFVSPRPWESPKLNHAVSHPHTMCSRGCSVSCLTHYLHHYHWVLLIFRKEERSDGTLCRDTVSVLSYQDCSISVYVNQHYNIISNLTNCWGNIFYKILIIYTQWHLSLIILISSFAVSSLNQYYYPNVMTEMMIKIWSNKVFDLYQYFFCNKSRFCISWSLRISQYQLCVLIYTHHM